jgi:peroxiredoxin
MREMNELSDPRHTAEFDEADYEVLAERPPFQIIRALGAVALTAAGFGIYEFVLTTFWSSPTLGVHLHTPYPAFIAMAAAMTLTAGALMLALTLASPHARLGFGLLAFMACAVVGVGGGRFASYLVRGTRNPVFNFSLRAGDRFPAFSLVDQSGAKVSGPEPGKPTLFVIYRGDFCPFARYELALLTASAREFQSAGVKVVAISADEPERSTMLAKFLGTSIPLLADNSESVLRPLGLVQKHVDGEPDNAIPAYVVVDSAGAVRWTFTSVYYRELPNIPDLLSVARAALTPAR